GNGVEAHHQRVEARIDGARPSDEDTETQSAGHSKREAERRGVERLQRILPDRRPVLDDGAEDDAGRWQDVLRQGEETNRGFPDDEQRRRVDPRRGAYEVETLARTAHAAFLASAMLPRNSCT